MREVLRNEYMVVTFDESARLVRAARTAVPLPGVERYESFADELERLYPRRERARLRMLMDVRSAPLRSDEAFEARMREIGARLVSGWARHAMLVRTAVGKLQMTRQSRVGGTSYAIYDDEAAAIAYLTAPDAAPPPPRK